jgi:general secretion pathway protein M
MTRKLSATSPLRFISTRAGFAVGLSLLLILVPVLFIVGYLIHEAVQVNNNFASEEPRLARLLGIRQAALQVREGRSAAESALSALAYPGEHPADRIGTELQQRLRTAADNAGVAISGSQVIDGKEEDGLEQIVVAMSFESSHGQLQQLLQALALQTPTVYVDSLILMPVRSRTAVGRLMVQARFCALRQAQ